jgi:hypothetical protein
MKRRSEMSMKSLMATFCGVLLAVSAAGALAQDTETKDAKKSCCTSACGMHASGTMRCSLTGKTVETCCCVQKEGKLHCTLADKDVESCCCQPVDESGQGGDHHQHGEGDQPQE